MLNIQEAIKGLTDTEIRDYVSSVTPKYFGRFIMATYTGKQSVNDEALGEYAQYGFQLVEPDDHLLELWFKDKRIAVYNQTKATFDIIREGCKNYLESITRSLD